MATFSAPFEIGDLVVVDQHGGGDLRAWVVGYYFQNGRTQVEIGWTANGDAKMVFIDLWRLQAAEKTR